MSTFTGLFLDLVNTSRQELEEAQKNLNEIVLLLRQTEAEIERSTQHSNQAYGKLREVEANLDNYSRADIRSAYVAASEGQLKLLMMQSQLEQLQNKRDTLGKYIELLQRLANLFENSPVADETPSASTDSQPYVYAASGELSGGQILARIIQAQEDERNRVAKAIHDGPAQALTNVVLRAEVCEKLIDVDPSRVRSELSMLKAVVASTLLDTRRFIFDLRPMILDDLGLVPTLKRYIQGFGERSKITIGLVTLGTERRFPPYVEAAIFRVIQEALENASKHANPARIQITLDMQADTIKFEIEDDGSGFEVEKVLRSARERKSGSVGIASILERVEVLGGSVEITSTPGLGTKVKVAIPTEVPSSER